MITHKLTKPNPTRTHLLFSLNWVRSMGGGPRTFPGGLNKWQWKRLHEKKAREKEKRLLDHEKQLYQARVRSQIRSSVSTRPESGDSGDTQLPVSPRDHVKALADRFVKAGAEDLWNDDDGPVCSSRVNPNPRLSIDPPVDLRRVLMEGGVGNLQQKRGFLGDGFGGKFEGYNGNLNQKRGFSVARRVLSDGYDRGFEGYNGNLQQNRDFCVGKRVLSDGYAREFGGYNGNLQQEKGFLVARRFLGAGYGGKFEGYYGNSVSLKGFHGTLTERRGFSTATRGKFKKMYCDRNFWSTSSDDDDDEVGHHVAVRGKIKKTYCDRNFWSTSSDDDDDEVGHHVAVRGKFKKTDCDRNFWSTSSDDDDDDEIGHHGVVRGNAKWPKFNLEGEGKGSKEGGEREIKKGFKGFMGNATLGKYDVKRTSRRIMNNIEKYVEKDEEGDLSKSIEVIRQEVNERKLAEEEKSFGKDLEDEDGFFGTRKRFEDCGISPLTVKALTSAGYELMTRVQEAALPTCLEGKDALVKAGSGTGKTAAFLLPAIETVLKAMSSDKVHRVPLIYVLILCPTRELASQIAAETRVMLKHHVGLGVQMLAGGTRFKDDLKRLESDPCQIVVATPGRLLDHIETKSGLSVRLMDLKMLVLDEADRLLDLGFRKDVEKIVDCLPRQRQSLCFSATIPKEVRRVSQLVLKREHALINAEDAGCPETSAKVKQSYITAPHDEHFQIVYQLLKEHISVTPDYKVIVFCSTGMVASLMYHLFHDMKLNVRELHTRKPQLYRSRVAEEFKQSKRLILISSDVSSRGVNYPDVTLVVQVGIPTSREQYMHRLGRTGREGKDGEGVLLLAPWEEYFLDDIKDMPVEKCAAPHIDPSMKLKIEDSMSKIDTSIKEAASHGWLGYYNSIYEIGRDKIALVQWANQFSNSIGLQALPALFRKTVVKMGLKGIPGIRVRK